MTGVALPAADYFNGAITNQNAKDAQDAELAFIRQSVVGTQPETELTIATGSVTPTTCNHTLDTEADADFDDLTNIALNNMLNGQLLMLRIVDPGRGVTLVNQAGGDGQMVLANAEDIFLNTIDRWIVFKLNGVNWEEMWRSWGRDDWVSRSGSLTYSELWGRHISLSITTTGGIDTVYGYKVDIDFPDPGVAVDTLYSSYTKLNFSGDTTGISSSYYGNYSQLFFSGADNYANDLTGTYMQAGLFGTATEIFGNVKGVKLDVLGDSGTIIDGKLMLAEMSVFMDGTLYDDVNLFKATMSVSTSFNSNFIGMLASVGFGDGSNMIDFLGFDVGGSLGDSSGASFVEGFIFSGIDFGTAADVFIYSGFQMFPPDFGNNSSLTDYYGVFVSGGPTFGTGCTFTNAAGVYIGDLAADQAPSGLHAGVYIAQQSGTAGFGYMYDSSNPFFVDVKGVLHHGGQSLVTSQFDKTNNTLANVTGLTADVLAGKKYHFRALLDVNAQATGGYKVAIAGTATATAVQYRVVAHDDADGSQDLFSRQTALGGSAGAAGATSLRIVVEGYIQVNAAGTLTVQFAQNVTNATASSVRVGSSFDVERLAE